MRTSVSVKMTVAGKGYTDKISWTPTGEGPPPVPPHTWDDSPIVLTTTPSTHDLKLKASRPGPMAFHLISGLKPELIGPLQLSADLILTHDGRAVPGGDTGIKIEVRDG